MGPIESSRSVNSYSGSIGPFSKVQNWTGNKKRATCFATLLQNELNSDVARFTTHIKPVLQQIRLLTGLNVGGKTRNIAIQRVLQQCYKKSCTFFRTRSFMKRSLTSLTRLRRETSVSIRKKCPLEPGVVNSLHLKEIKGAFCLKTEIFRRPFFYQ